jgi:hypothetical protein
MIDYSLIAIVVAVAGVLYAVIRIVSSKPIEAGDLIKFGGLSGGITAGVLYFMENGDASTITEAAQDMFVGKPSF